MIAPTAIALSGMNAAQTRLQASAHNIANLGTASFRRQQVSQTAETVGGVSATVTQAPESGSALETDVVGLLQAKNSFLANLAVFRSGDKMVGSLLDALG
jgi:flagellar basal body rod protein FlgG